MSISSKTLSQSIACGMLFLTACEPGVVGPINPGSIDPAAKAQVASTTFSSLNSSAASDPSLAPSSRLTIHHAASGIGGLPSVLARVAADGSPLGTGAGTPDLGKVAIENAVFLAFLKISANAENDIAELMEEMKSSLETKKNLRDQMKSAREAARKLKHELAAGAARKFNTKAEEGYQPWEVIEEDEALVTNPYYSQNVASGENELFEGSNETLSIGNSNSNGALTYSFSCPSNNRDISAELVRASDSKVVATQSGKTEFNFSGNYSPNQFYYSRIKVKIPILGVADDASATSIMKCTFKISKTRSSTYKAEPLSDSQAASLERSLSGLSAINAELNRAISELNLLKVENRREAIIGSLFFAKIAARQEKLVHDLRKILKERTKYTDEVEALAESAAIIETALNTHLTRGTEFESAYEKVSNVIKTKHDTVKNSINNVR